MLELRYVLLGCLAIALLYAAFSDLRSRRIANWLNAGIAVTAPLYWWACGLALWPHVAWQIGLAAAAFAVLAVMFAFRVMGGGDVKLLTALALWLQPLPFAKMLLIMAVIGGFLTVVFGAWHVARRRKDKLAIPYGVAIAAGALWVLSPDLARLTQLLNGGIALQ